MEPSTQPATIQFLRCVLRPLLRIAIRSGLSTKEVVDLVSSESIAAAQEILVASGRAARVTDISATTGLSRVTVRNSMLSRHQRSENYGVRRANLVLAAWYEVPAYLDGRRKPKALPMHGPVSFFSLATGYGKDTTPKAILKDLLNARAVLQLEAGRLRVVSRTLSPIVPDARYFARQGRKTADLLQQMDTRVALVQRPGKL